MLIQFSVENFRSFKERQIFSLVASKDKNFLDENTCVVNDKYRLLKVAVLHGANASGKSNFFYALNSFLTISIISGPRWQKGEKIRTEPFLLDLQTKNEPTSFELMFFLPNDVGSNIRYKYGFSIDSTHFIKEYLYAVNNVREVMLFERDGQTINFDKRNFPEGETFNSKIVRENAAYLSVCAQNNGEISGNIVDYFGSILVTSGLDIGGRILHKDFDVDKNLERIGNFLQFADIQVQGLEKRNVPIPLNNIDPDILEVLKKKNPNIQNSLAEQIFYNHIAYDNGTIAGTVPIPEELESVGTRKLFDYAGMFLPVLDNGGILFIDEFDSSLHPLIVESIVKLFNNPAINKKNAQLVISCQSVNLLTNKLLRRDQIWFCEKDKFGASDLYSLLDIDEPVRKDSTFNKSYLAGKYGAVPFVDNVKYQMGFVN